MRNTYSNIDANTLKGKAILELARLSSGKQEYNSLIFSGATVDGDKFTVGGTTYHIKSFNTGALVLANAALDNTDTGVIPGVGITAHGMSVNHIFRVASEYFKVVRVGSVDSVDVSRGYAGSTIATHAAAQDVDLAANYTGINIAKDVILPVAGTLAIATAGPLLATAFNALNTYGITAEYSSTGTTLLLSRAAQGNALATTGTITNATVYSAVFTRGVQTGETYKADVVHQVTAGDVTAGYIDFVFPFVIKDWVVAGVVTSSRARATLGSTVAFSSDFKRLRLTNNATNDFAATQMIRVSVFG